MVRRVPAKPREGRFGYMWFVCNLKFHGWCSKLGPKSKTHCASYIVHERTADHILTSWKMAASSVLTVNYRGDALFVNVFVPNKESCLRQNGKFTFMCEKNCELTCCFIRFRGMEVQEQLHIL